MRQLKSKRWYRRNRHSNRDLFDARKVCEFRFEVFHGEYPYPRYSEEFRDVEIKIHHYS